MAYSNQSKQEAITVVDPVCICVCMCVSVCVCVCVCGGGGGGGGVDRCYHCRLIKHKQACSHHGTCDSDTRWSGRKVRLLHCRANLCRSIQLCAENSLYSKGIVKCVYGP